MINNINVLKSRVDRLVEAQKEVVNQFLNEAKNCCYRQKLPMAMTIQKMVDWP